MPKDGLHHLMATLYLLRALVLAGTAAVLLKACERDVETVVQEARPVRTITVDKRDGGAPVVLTGRIAAEEEAALAFRISGRVVENNMRLGDRVRPGQIVARLEPHNELNALRTAQASLAAAKAQLVRTRNDFARQETLVKQGHSTRVRFDQAKQELQAAQSQVETAEAQLKVAQDVVSYTELKADGPGVLTEIGPRAGEVVQAGQMIVRLARDGGRDAVFDAPARLLRSAPKDSEITVSLADDAAVRTMGRVRAVAPQADPVTRTFTIKVALKRPPDAMRLGATVNGHIHLKADAVIEIPATALVKADREPAVWIVDASSLTVSMRPVDIVRYDPDKIVISRGLAPGEIVVTAGVHALHPGQKVRLLERQP
jgi:membrane fusion protein, multidrug efflux system